jgi:hypothetical protein
MRTAIFVYQSTQLNIVTSEDNLQLCQMNASDAPLAAGANTLQIAPGIYKIVSNNSVDVTGETCDFDTVVSPDDKTALPKPPPRRVPQVFTPFDLDAVQSFFAVPNAAGLANP